MSEASGEKKIIIDEDWKTQAQREKEELLEKSAQQPTPSASSSPETPSIPEASLGVLISLLATQAMVCLGQIPSPATNEPELHPEEAKHFIDLLDVLQQKTQGNCTPEESAALEQLLHELRMIFVNVQSGGAQPADSQSQA